MAFGELEHLILLQILRLRDDAYALEIRDALKTEAGREVTRGALYRSLDRLADKSYIRWRTIEPDTERGGHARRRFTVTEEGRAALAARRDVLLHLWDGLEGVLKS